MFITYFTVLLNVHIRLLYVFTINGWMDELKVCIKNWPLLFRDLTQFCANIQIQGAVDTAVGKDWS